MPDKKCSKCGEVKDVGEFHKAASGKFGVRGDCKECAKQYYSQYYIDNREEISEYDRLYRMNHREEIAQYWVDYWIKNKNRHNEGSLNWYYNNKYPHLKNLHRKKNDTKLTIV